MKITVLKSEYMTHTEESVEVHVKISIKQNAHKNTSN